MARRQRTRMACSPVSRRRDLLKGLAGIGLAAGLPRLTGAVMNVPPATTATEGSLQAGLILPVSHAGTWDSAQLSNPRVIRLGATDWRMWYYGRDPDFDPLVRLPTGRIGLAVSTDGRHWQRVTGSATRGAVMDPAADPERFDSAHIGVGDVHATANGFEMWYFGGPQNVQQLGELTFNGFPLRIGHATSRDGEHWQRQSGPFSGAILNHGAPGETDAFMVGWPQVINLSADVRRMYYHSVNPVTNKFFICAAESVDGDDWKKLGVIFGPGEPDAFDVDGPATRHVIRRGDDFLMFYEGFREQRASIGLARSADGLSWTRVPGAAARGAIFAPAEAEPGAWDSGAVGTPWLIQAPDGGLLMYYVGAGYRGEEFDDLVEAEASAVHQIGLATCDGEDLTRWTRWQACD